MREEFIKRSFEIDGVTVYDDGQDYIFTAKNDKGEEVEHHLTKKDPFPIDDKRGVPLSYALKASIAFPNLPFKEAVEKYKN